MLGWRQFDERSSGDGAASSQVSSVGRPSVVQPPWTQYAVASSQQAACDTLADRWDVIEGLSALPDEALQTYTNSLVAPMAASETLSEESSASSRGSIVRRVRVWRRARPEPTTTSVGTFLVPLDPTEGSSVYCLSPLSSVRAVGGGSPATRSQLKKEIMRLYQRAAADIDDGQETSSPERNESSSSQVSQPNSPPNSYSSPVFRHCASFDESSPGRTAFAVGRPATTEELVNTSLQQSPPSRYTSFWFSTFSFPFYSCSLHVSLPIRFWEKRYDVLSFVSDRARIDLHTRRGCYWPEFRSALRYLTGIHQVSWSQFLFLNTFNYNLAYVCLLPDQRATFSENISHSKWINLPPLALFCS